MVAYAVSQQRKKEESERLRGERYQIKFIDLGFERWQILRFRKARGRKMFVQRKIVLNNANRIKTAQYDRSRA